MDIHTQQLRHFMELAKCLNFTKAAMNLYIAQPALSQQIAELEKQLGVTLFERTSRSVSLTPAGEILKRACPDILNKINNVQQQLLSAQAGLLGNLKIGYLSPFQSVLPKIVQKYRELYQDVAVDLFSGALKEMQMAIRGQDADIIFTAIHPDIFTENDVYAWRMLWQEGMHLVIRKDHPFALSGGRDYSLLCDETFYFLDDEEFPGFRQLVQNICSEIGLPITKVAICKTANSIAMHVATGMSAGVFSTQGSELFCGCHENLVSFPLKENCLIFCALWNPKSRNAALPLFLDVLESSLETAPAG